MCLFIVTKIIDTVTGTHVLQASDVILTSVYLVGDKADAITLTMETR